MFPFLAPINAGARETRTRGPLRIQEIRSIAFIYSCVPRWSGLIGDLPDPRSHCRQGMSPAKTAPYGSWLSPITSDLIVAQSVALAEVLAAMEQEAPLPA